MNNFKWLNYLDLRYYETDFIGKIDDYTSIKDDQEHTRWFEQNVIKTHQYVSSIRGEDYYVVETDRVWIELLDELVRIFEQEPCQRIPIYFIFLEKNTDLYIFNFL